MERRNYWQHRLVTTTSAFLLAALLAGCSQQVQVGEIVTCKRCQKEISNSVTTLEVASWNADKYHVTRSSAYCQQCGDEQVPYKISTRCRKCGQVYISRQELAARKLEKREVYVADGFCSEQCEKAAKVDATIDRVSQKTGDIIGRIGRGISDGIKNHTR